MDSTNSETPEPNPSEAPGRKPGEGAAFLVTIVLLVAIALLGVALWKTIGKDFETAPAGTAAEGEPAEAPPAAPDEIVATVDGEPIRFSEVRAAMASFPEQMQGALNTKEGRQAVVEELVRMKLLEKYARSKGLDRRPEVSARLSIAQGNILMNAAAADIMRGLQGTPREIYDRNPALFETVELSQIVIPYQGSLVAQGAAAPSESDAMAQASQVVAQIRGGADFAALAREKSADRQSGEAGGAMGAVSRNALPENLKGPIFAAQPGTVLDPMKTEFGIHVFRVGQKRMRPFEEVEQALQGRGGQEVLLQQRVEQMREKASVKIETAALERPMAAAAPAQR